jgi:hypothetical protein
MSGNRHEELLRQAAEMAREGRTTEARALVQEVLAEDEENVRAWLWMYRLSDDVSEKRMALTNVLQLDPGNTRAQEALEKLERRTGVRPPDDDEEIAPGITRRQLMLFGGGALAVAVIILIAVLVLVNVASAPTREAAAQATAFSLTEMAEEAAVAGTATAEAQATIMEMTLTTATPTATETRVGPPTLPATFTPTFTPTPLMSPTPLPLPEGVSGLIFGWGGPDQINDGYFPILSLPVSGGGNFQVVSGRERGIDVTANNRDRMYYVRYFPQNFQTLMETVDLNAGQASLLFDQYQGVTSQSFSDSRNTNLSRDGSLIAYTAIAANNATREVYIFDTRQVGVGDPIIRITNDNANHAYPALSPDGSQMVVVRQVQTDLQRTTDLFIQNIQTLETQPYSTDGDITLETTPRWSPDGRIIVYAARPQGEQNHDLYIRAADGTSQALRITSSPADDIHPVFSPDSRYIAFASNRQGSYDIFIYDQQTGGLSQLTNSRDDFFPGAWVE